MTDIELVLYQTAMSTRDTRIAELERKLTSSETIRRSLNALYFVEKNGKTTISTHARIAELEAELFAWKRAAKAASDRADAGREKVDRLREALTKICSVNAHEPDCNQSGEFLDARDIAREAIAATAPTTCSDDGCPRDVSVHDGCPCLGEDDTLK